MRQLRGIRIRLGVAAASLLLLATVGITAPPAAAPVAERVSN